MRTNIKKQLNNINDRLDKFIKYTIEHTIIFTSDTEFCYLFNVYNRHHKLVETCKIDASDIKGLENCSNSLENKYKTKIITNYDTLSTEQLNYLIDVMEGISDAK